MIWKSFEAVCVGAVGTSVGMAVVASWKTISPFDCFLQAGVFLVAALVFGCMNRKECSRD